VGDTSVEKSGLALNRKGVLETQKGVGEYGVDLQYFHRRISLHSMFSEVLEPGFDSLAKRFLIS